MQISEMKSLALSNSITGIKFIESGCSPIVIQLYYRSDKAIHKALLKKDDKVATFRCLEQAYSLCRNAGIHKAELVQTFTHDEACAGLAHQPLNDGMELRF